jgi:hypothetical protein
MEKPHPSSAAVAEAQAAAHRKGTAEPGHAAAPGPAAGTVGEAGPLAAVTVGGAAATSGQPLLRRCGSDGEPGCCAGQCDSAGHGGEGAP